MKIYNVDFEEVSDPCFLGKTKPGFDGFSSAGVATTKKFKRDPDSGMIVLTNKKIKKQLLLLMKMICKLLLKKQLWLLMVKLSLMNDF